LDKRSAETYIKVSALALAGCYCSQPKLFCYLGMQ